MVDGNEVHFEKSYPSKKNATFLANCSKRHKKTGQWDF
jgi:hypothetical protein